MKKKIAIAGKVLENKGKEFAKTESGINVSSRITFETKSGKRFSLELREIWASATDYLWPGSEIYLLHVSPEDEENLILDNHGYLVLEPDTLVSPTAIRNSEGCSRKHYIQRRLGITGKNYAMIRGTLVNNAFDQLLESSEKSRQEIMDAVLKDFLIDLASLAESELPEPEKIRGELDRHFTALSVWRTHKKFLQSEQKSTEPTFISRKYGLSGRLDLLVDPGQKAITYELKTGKAPESSPWPNDMLQVACYQLLLESALDCTNPDSYLIYSQGKGNQLLRQCSLDYLSRRKVIALRNRIVAIDFALSKSQEKELYQQLIPPTESGHCEKCLFKKECFAICQKLGEKNCQTCGVAEICQSKERKRDEQAVSYYQKNFHFVELERQESRKNFSRVFEKMADVIKEGKAIVGLSFVSLQGKTLELIAEKPIEAEIRAGDLVLLYQEKITRGEVFKATVKKIDQYQVFLVMKKTISPELFADKEWHIYTDTMETTFDTMNTALLQILAERNHHKRDLLLGRKSPFFANQEEININENGLNESQTKAIKGAIGAEDYFLIQGPPGTGKSFTLAKMIIELVKRGKKVILSAFTHRAIDNVLEKLLEEGFTDFLRIGSHEVVAENIFPYLVQERCKDYLFADLKKVHEEISGFPVVACSSAAAVSSGLIRRLGFDVAVVDEAGQLTEPSTLAIILRAKKFILVGDHKQLPPVIQNQEAIKSGFSRSLFERLISLNSGKNAQVLVTLGEQYRMNEKIMEFSNKNFYQSQLLASPKVAKQQLKFPREISNSSFGKILLPENNLIFVNLTEKSTAFKVNKGEAKLLARICSEFFHFGISPEQIGIITPFRAQVAEIKREILNKIAKEGEPNVDTVDRFQGSDRDIIMFSAVICSPEQVSDFYTDFRRINVTVTRAKKKFILVGNQNILTELPLFQDLISRSITVDLAVDQ